MPKVALQFAEVRVADLLEANGGCIALHFNRLK